MNKANENIPDVRESELQEMQFGLQVIFSEMLKTLRIDTKNDPHTQGTAARMAKMYCREIFAGRFKCQPEVTKFPAGPSFNLISLGPISLRSTCSHHFCPITGRVWIGYVPNKFIAGISKFPRLIEWVAARPQVQEEMTEQIAEAIDSAIQPLSVYVLVEGLHTCMSGRGVKEHGEAAMQTAAKRGGCYERFEREFAEFVARTAK